MCLNSVDWEKQGVKQLKIKAERKVLSPLPLCNKIILSYLITDVLLTGKMIHRA